MSETVVVTQVAGPNDRGWYEIELEDGRKPNTKSREIAEAAMQRRGTPVEVTLNERKNGRYTNLYVNQFDTIEDAKPSGNGASRSSSTSGRKPAPRDDERQRIIEKEWAYGRSVELLMASQAEFELPLDAATIRQLDETAELLLSKIR